MSDEQDRAEARDESKLGTEYPPDAPLGVDQYGTTAAEERVDEPLDEAVARENPDLAPISVDVTQPAALTEDPDEANQEIADLAEVPRPDPERAADDLEGSGQVPAEQAALHVEGPPD